MVASLFIFIYQAMYQHLCLASVSTFAISLVATADFDNFCLRVLSLQLI